ncbi:hypothetical protein CPLU01_02625 [Colletotrichum plurivorum]|uniref:Uncharacterized protein n=1 Tax=Colletotrichum plurivorum TaxID=2175906 RepID=A0A8H6NLX2_9PEZI|nr:hypothetical protein CPLU01_02625 [Colletotrichum plurivorum]
MSSISTLQSPPTSPTTGQWSEHLVNTLLSPSNNHQPLTAAALTGSERAPRADPTICTPFATPSVGPPAAPPPTLPVKTAHLRAAFRRPRAHHFWQKRYRLTQTPVDIL